MKKGLSIKGLLVLALVLGVFAAVAFPKYFFELEKSKAAGAEVVLVSVMLAENEYFIRHKSYTGDWAELTPFLAVPASIGMNKVSAKSEGDTMFYAFTGAKPDSSSDGFAFTLALSDDGQQVTVSAARRGSVRYEYQLDKELPLGNSACSAESRADKKLCGWFKEYLDSLTIYAVAPEETGATPSEQLPVSDVKKPTN